MTELLSPPRNPAVSHGPVARPLWLSAGVAGVVASGAVLTACMAVGLAGWFASDAGGHGDTRDALRVGSVAWLLAHGSGLHLSGADIGVVPLGLTALCGYVTFRLGRWARLTSADDDPRAVALAAVVLAGVYAVVALVAALLASLPAAQPGLMPAFAGGFLLSLLAGGGGLLRLHPGAPGPSVGIPATVRAIVCGAAGVALAVLAAGAVLATTALALDIGTGATVLSRLHPDGAGSALYTGVVAAVAPNVALMGSAYLLGPGFAVGTGTLVSPAVVVLGPLPAFPLLAALPAPGPGHGWATGLVVIPVLLAAAVAGLVVRRYPSPGYDIGAVRGLGSGVVGGVVVAVLVDLAGGPTGPGRMADVGAPFLDTLASAVVALGIGGLVGGVLATWLLRRSAAPDPDTEDTIRL